MLTHTVSRSPTPTLRRLAPWLIALACAVPGFGRDRTTAVVRPDALSSAEQVALRQHQDEFRQNHAAATLVVYPVQIGQATDTESATRIARLVSRLSISDSTRLGPATVLPVGDGAGSVWDLARTFGEHLRRNPAPADYALFVTYTFDAQQQAWTVLQYVLCTGRGECVTAERQDLRAPKYRAIEHTVKSDCDEWIVCWLQRATASGADGAFAAAGR